jgi:hypothetical protein
MVNDARTHNVSWVTAERMTWGVAMAAPTDTIEDMVEWCDLKRTHTYDRRVGTYYLRVLQWRCLYTWPSLVDHRRGKSLLNHSSHRYAQHAHLEDAFDVNLEGPVVDLEAKRPVRSMQEVWNEYGDVRVGR